MQKIPLRTERSVLRRGAVVEHPAHPRVEDVNVVRYHLGLRCGMWAQSASLVAVTLVYTMFIQCDQKVRVMARRASARYSATRDWRVLACERAVTCNGLRRLLLGTDVREVSEHMQHGLVI